MTAINIRGTSGSGKSHLARRILAYYPNRVLNLFKPEERQPMSCLYTNNGHRPLFILGHYEAVHGGGADTVTRELGFKQLLAAASANEPECDILWEGLLFSDEVTQTIAVSRLQETHIIFLTTPVEQCLADIRARREARGNVKPLSEKNTVQRVDSLKRVYDRLRTSQAPGIKVYRLDREEAFLRCKELLAL